MLKIGGGNALAGPFGVGQSGTRGQVGYAVVLPQPEDAGDGEQSQEGQDDKCFLTGHEESL